MSPTPFEPAFRPLAGLGAEPIAIAGASGYLGRNIARALQAGMPCAAWPTSLLQARMMIGDAEPDSDRQLIEIMAGSAQRSILCTMQDASP